MCPQPSMKKAKAKTRPLLEPLPLTDGSGADAQPGNSQFARALGSCDFLTRERGVQALTRLLQRKTDITEADMVKLWKGLYFCFWHSDKTPVQAELAERLSTVLRSLSEPVAWLYFSVFLTTMRREWFSIDRLRLDKFLLLIRKFVSQMLLYLRQHEWRTDLVEQFSDWLQSHVLLPGPGEPHTAVGLAYHLCDIFIPELRLVLSTDPTTSGQPAQLSAAVATQLLQPFVATLQRGGEDAMVNRVREAVFEPLLEEVQGDGEEEAGSGGGGGSVLGGALLPTDLATTLFDLGAVEGVRARNRTALYGLSQALEKAAKKRAKREGQGAAGRNKGKKAAQQQVQQPQATSQQQQEVVAAEPAGATEPVQAAESGKKRGKGRAGVETGTPAPPVVAPAPAPAAAEAEELPAPAGAATAGSSKKRRARGGVPDAPLSNAAATAVPQANGIAVASAPADATTAPASQGKAGKGAKPGPLSINMAAPVACPAAADSAAPVAGATTRKGKAGADGGTAARGVRWQDGAAGGDSGAKAAAGAAAAANGQASVPSTPAAAGTGGVLPVAPSTKKSVRINLRKNLYFEFQGPVPDPMVRTPPSSRSKGGILKVHSLTAMKQPKRARRQGGMQGQAPHSAPPKVTIRVPQQAVQQALAQRQQQQQGAGAKVVTPGSVPRVKAADLFQ